jgi:dTDP-4-amino-4,6-dideoxygalactose transaminase
MTQPSIAFTGLRKQYANLREEILDATDQVLASGCLMNGPFTLKFEEWLAQKNHSNYAVLCHSGTQALEILAGYYRTEHSLYQWVSNVPTVIIPAMTFPASANAFVRAGWNIQLIDTDASGNMNFDSIPPDLNYQAILGIGLYGAALSNSLRRIRPLIIEDAAQHWLSDRCHRVGESSAISFDPMKNLNNYGNGGAVVTNDRNLSDYARNWCDNGKRSGHAQTGSNSRMNEVDCAQMMDKTAYLDQWQARRESIARRYMAAFGAAPFRCLIDDSNVSAHCFHKFVIDVDNRDQLQVDLQSAGIETRVHYQHPLHELAAYQQYAGPSLLSAASSLSRRCLSLPIYPELTDSEVDYVIDQVLDYV